MGLLGEAFDHVAGVDVADCSHILFKCFIVLPLIIKTVSILFGYLSYYIFWEFGSQGYLLSLSKKTFLD